MLLNIMKGLRVKVEKEPEREPFVKFDDLTRAIVFRAFCIEKDKSDLNIV
jgi:hypothetical protein